MDWLTGQRRQNFAVHSHTVAEAAVDWDENSPDADAAVAPSEGASVAAVASHAVAAAAAPLAAPSPHACVAAADGRTAAAVEGAHTVAAADGSVGRD